MFPITQRYIYIKHSYVYNIKCWEIFFSVIKLHYDVYTTFELKKVILLQLEPFFFFKNQVF